MITFERFEDRGYFVELTFDREEDPTVVFVADRDFLGLENMAEDSDADWESFREELFELLEHSGHREDHELGEQTTREVMKAFREFDSEATSDESFSDQLSKDRSNSE